MKQRSGDDRHRTAFSRDRRVEPMIVSQEVLARPGEDKKPIAEQGVLDLGTARFPRDLRALLCGPASIWSMERLGPRVHVRTDGDGPIAVVDRCESKIRGPKTCSDGEGLHSFRHGFLTASKTARPIAPRLP